MPFVSVTRLRIRSMRFLPRFALHALRSQRQVAASPGFITGTLLPDRRWVFWTLTVWESEAAMRAYMTSGSHRKAMPLLFGWCDEASVAHWEQPDATLPGWAEAAARLRSAGRRSKVRFPTPDHVAGIFAEPRIIATGPIKPKRPRAA